MREEEGVKSLFWINCGNIYTILLWLVRCEFNMRMRIIMLLAGGMHGRRFLRKIWILNPPYRYNISIKSAVDWGDDGGRLRLC
jgi:hypothetical protein